MVSKSFIILVVTLFLFLLADVDASTRKLDRRKAKEAFGLTRERIIENHKRRLVQLEKLINDAKNQIKDHKSGRKLMESEEYEKVKKRIELYEQKLAKMPAEPDERDIKRMLDREKMRLDRKSQRDL